MKIKVFLKILRNFLYDAVRYTKHSGSLIHENDKRRLSAHLKMDFHRIEKGLALKDCRPGFGLDVVERLMANTRRYEEFYGPSEITKWVKQALGEYRAFNRGHGISLDSLDEFLSNSKFEKNDGGTQIIDPEELRCRSKIDFHAFAHSRHSVRHFSENPVEFEDIKDAILAASRTPSVCNRQSAHAHIVLSEPLKTELLAVQGGNRGFGHQIPSLIVVTSELRNFVTAAERYQCWVDGGLFAMSLIYGLHAKGLATCMLNWSVDPSRDIAARKLLNLSDTENIIVMIAVGHFPSQLRVAQSPRLPVDTMLSIH
ncbi:MAG: nitroreductase family protein [Parasphingorhabdus sp.]|uniref:nitroreductase family protein n=1 Tax=Parasphingorhabdus sp. TaxID=2709688 RepID=UPI0030033AE7